MALSKNKKGNSEETTEREYEVKITRAKEIDNCIMIDMEVNGVNIYGAAYRTLQRKDGSGEFAKISFPSRKVSDGNYYNQAYFKISDKLMDDIEKQIDKLI